MKLFCFTFAGGTAAFFNKISEEINGIECVRVEYAGHGDRRKEPFYRSFDELTADMYRIVADGLNGDEEYALFGYSMGTIAVIEILQKIICDGKIKAPKHIFLAAHEPHSKAELVDYTEEELDEYVKERTIRFGGVPEKLIYNKSFWRVYLPIYRVDYSIIAKYLFEEIAFTTDIPFTIFYSETDTPFEEMKLWAKYFKGNGEYHLFEGNHFFINEHYKDMARIIEKRITE